MKKTIIFLTLLAFTASFFPIAAVEAQAKGGLQGFVFGPDKKTPIQEAVVMLRSTDDNREFQSTPTPQNGSYQINDLPEGTYVAGIKIGEDTYNVSGFVKVAGGKISIASFYIHKEDKKAAPVPVKGFFAKPLGIALAVAGTIATGVVIYSLVKEDEEVSGTIR